MKIYLEYSYNPPNIFLKELQNGFSARAWKLLFQLTLQLLIF